MIDFDPDLDYAAPEESAPPHIDPDLEYAAPRESAPPPIDPEKFQHCIDLLRTRQHLQMGVIGGLIGAVIGAAIWVGITVTTNHQIGWMAIGVGALVGVMVRALGCGIDAPFGIAGAVLALLACLGGNLVAACWFVAAADKDLAFQEVVLGLTPGQIVALCKATIQPIDLLFYVLAAATAFRLSIRRITAHDLEAVTEVPRGRRYPTGGAGRWAV